MKTHRFELVLALAFALILLAFCHWQTPGNKLTADEISFYLSRFDKHAPLSAEDKQAVIMHLRAWGESDDGRPVYNLNLMRYYQQLRDLPGVKVEAKSVPDANAKYEERVMPMILRRGVYPGFGGTVQQVMPAPNASTNLVSYEPNLDNWSRVLVVRYPSRRAFLDLITDPAYLKVMPYKLASLKVVLTPVNGDIVIPDLRYLLGSSLLCVFMLIGWVRSHKRLKHLQAQRR